MPNVGISYAVMLTFYYVSLAITVLATVLIIIRIVWVVKQCESNLGSYRLTMEVVIESGLLYALVLAITSVLNTGSSSPRFWGERPQVLIASSYFQQILPPVTVQIQHTIPWQSLLTSFLFFNQFLGYCSNIDCVPHRNWTRKR